MMTERRTIQVIEGTASNLLKRVLVQHVKQDDVAHVIAHPIAHDDSPTGLTHRLLPVGRLLCLGGVDLGADNDKSFPTSGTRQDKLINRLAT
jgi:hypothetical protein